MPLNWTLAKGKRPIACPRCCRIPSARRSCWKPKARAATRRCASLQNVMLRLLTTLPPGKVRFTIIDPVGLGENFAAFMHLADYDEQLVTSRIWTEPAHIEQRLADLTEHMENVIQKYLRNEFASIEEYNAARRRGGRAVPRPGGRQLPGELHRRGGAAAGQHRRQRRAVRRLHADQRRHASCRCRATSTWPTWKRSASTLVWNATAAVPLEGRRAAAVCRWRSTRRPTTSVHRRSSARVGEQAKDAGRVEVPFEFIAPPADAVVDRPTAAAASTCRSAGPGRRSCSTCGWARARRSTCSSPARPARASRRCCTR